MPPSRAASLFVGRDRALTFRDLLVAVGLFVVTLGMWGLLWGINTYEPTWPLPDLRVLVVTVAPRTGHGRYPECVRGQPSDHRRESHPTTAAVTTDWT